MKSEMIRNLNDTFRTSLFPAMGKLMFSDVLSQYPDAERQKIIGKVIEYDTWTEDNDPYGEHDFGAFDYMGDKLFWKIDYYDKNLEYGSEDPSNPGMTTRVLTIMLASEY